VTSIATIYTVNLQHGHDEQTFSQVLEYLPHDVRNKVAKYRLEQDARREMVSAVLKRIIACEINGIGLREADFLRDGFGKPSLKGFPDFHFNVSHAMDWVVCAVSAEGPIGVDIEKMGEAEPEVAQLCFSPQELAEWNEQPGHLRNEFFYELWTLKESYAKAIGKGLSVDFSTFEKVKTGDMIYISHQGAIDLGFYLRSISFDVDYKLAACLSIADRYIDFQNYTLTEIISRFMELIDRGM